MNITISKITVKIGDKEIELTLDEARELQRLLNSTLSSAVSVPSVWTTPVVNPPYTISYLGASTLPNGVATC